MIDVARLAGVSTMTVSRVLNKASNVSESMRQRVFEATEQLHYQPNELARSLRKQRSRQIGVLVPNLSDPFFATCAHMISTVAKLHAYSVVLSTSNEDQQAEYEEANRMLRRNVEGLIVIPANHGGKASLLLAREFDRLPIVTLDRPIAGSRFDSLLVENEHGAQIGTTHLLSLGHKRILFLGLSDDLYTMKMRHAGYTAAMTAAALVPRSAILSGELDDTRTVLREILAQKRQPSALFCANNLTTRRVLCVLQEMGINPPEKLALVGFDDFEMAEVMRPGTTVVRQPTELLGRKAAEILFERLGSNHPLKPGKEHILSAELVIRGSCGSKSNQIQ
jgi:LacI family transcriptional regulator